MDELELTAALHRDPGDPPGTVFGEGRRRLADRIADRPDQPDRTDGHDRHDGSRWALWPRWTFVATAGLVAAAVILMAAPAGKPPAGDPAPEPAARPGPARQFLLAAASTVERQAAPAGTYWHVETRRTDYFRVGRPGRMYVMAESQREESWTSRDRRLPSRSVDQHLGVRPATPADARQWRRAGSPRALPVPALRSGPNNSLQVTGPRPAQESADRRYDDTAIAGPGFQMTVRMEDLRTLPSDPVRLKARLVELYSNGRAGNPGDAWLFDIATQLSLGMPITPQVRGGAFRMLAGLGGVRLTRQARDGSGRTGAAVWIRARDPRGGTLERRLLIDPATGRALAHESAVVTPGGGYADFPPGAVVHYFSVVHAEWTDRIPD